MSGFYFLLILLFCGNYDSVGADDPWSTPPNVYPRSQKVAENSPAVFTCVSYIPGADISWYKSGRRLDEIEDEVTIRRINDVTSVLRIDAANIKKHKKTFSCRIEFEGKQETISVNLKVMSSKRLHKNFPHITPVRSGDDYMLPSTDPNTVRMKCESLANKKSTPTWRWIKDDFIDLSIDDASDDDTNDRIEVTDDGELIIEGVSASDSGRYMCVATNNRGSAYGTPIKVSVQQGPSIPSGCVDDLGVRSEFGETYNHGGDLCTNCTCVEGVGVRCRSVSCIPIYCSPGQRRVKNEEKCCDYRCVPETEDGTEASMCTDRDGLNVASGQIFKPEEDPCMQCVCDNGRRGRCMMVACQAPTCKDYISSRDICCNYTCLPTLPEPSNIEGTCRDHMGVMISDGEMYHPDSTDPCKTCECVNGRAGFCTQVVCDEPTCRNYKLIPGTCCGFECPDEEIESVELDLDGGCRNYDGTFVGNGEPYQPRSDTCFTCTCSNGYPTLCRSISCVTPESDCQNLKRVPGKCCEFYCEHPSGPVSDNVEKVLGRIFIQQIGSNKAFVQWKIPEKYAAELSNLTVFSYINSLNSRSYEAINIGDRPYAILNDLDPNFEYHVVVNGTLENGAAFMSSLPVQFSLDGRGRSSFVLSDAIGQVFESRGSIAYEGYSLPRKFEPVVRPEGIKIILNTESFHRVEITRYNESPCMDQHCGLLRFYVYTVEGESKNVLSLMFTNEQDFTWAKGHL